MPDNYERLVRWYLRFNGYFTVENFYIHNPLKVHQRKVGCDTETDIIGIRMPYSSEVVGGMKIENHKALVAGSNGVDVVIAEVKKNGKPSKPNRIWRHPKSPKALATIAYMVRFIGVARDEKAIQSIAARLAEDFHYCGRGVRIRYIMFSKALSRGYVDRVQNISFTDIVRFLDEQRGQCWQESALVSALYTNSGRT